MTESTSFLLSRMEAAAYLRISPRTLARRTAEGRIRYISACPGGRVHYRKIDLEKYIKDNTHIRHTRA